MLREMERAEQAQFHRVGTASRLRTAKRHSEPYLDALTRSAAPLERRRDLIEMLVPVLGADGVDRTRRVARGHPI